jgi:hypothetical protein
MGITSIKPAGDVISETCYNLSGQHVSCGRNVLRGSEWLVRHFWMAEA